jgi:hypothetical protein
MSQTGISAALKYLRSCPEDVRDHYVWLLKRLLTNLKPRDLSTESIVSLVAILIPEHSRLLASPEPGAGDGGVVLNLVASGVCDDRVRKPRPSNQGA